MRSSMSTVTSVQAQQLSMSGLRQGVGLEGKMVENQVTVWREEKAAVYVHKNHSGCGNWRRRVGCTRSKRSAVAGEGAGGCVGTCVMTCPSVAGDQ